MTAVRNGTHPLDDEVGNTGMLGWLQPTLELAFRHLLTLAPVSAVFCLLIVTARYWVQWIPVPTNDFAAYFWQMLATLISTGIAAVGYCLLASREGTPHGVGGLASLASIAGRLSVMVLIWSVASTVLSWLLRGLFETDLMRNLLIFIFRTFGLLNGAFFTMWLLSPLLIVLATLSVLCNVMCIRTELGITEIFRLVFGRVYEQIGRLLIPGLIVSAILLTILRILSESSLGGARFIANYPNLVACSLIVVFVTIGLSWWFVLERAWVPEAGVENDLVDDERILVPHQLIKTPQLASRAEAVQLSAGQALEMTRKDLQTYLGNGQIDNAVGTFIDWLRGGQRSVAELSELLTLLEGQWPALAQPLSALTAELARNNRSFEAVELTRYGLRHDATFLGDQADTVPSFAKRLVQLEHPDLAIRLLATYVRQHRMHPGYLGAGLLLARLLMSHANQPEAARKLLTHLKSTFPQEMQIDLLLRQLGTAP